MSSFYKRRHIGKIKRTLKGTFFIELDEVIGGEENCGNGWKMLMECLATGRAISLPASANGSVKAVTFGIYHYGMNRKQFNIPLLKMEGIQNKFIDMVYNTWIINSGISMTNTILDNGAKPSVISAIMKQQTTDRARDVLNNAMDIYAGSAICLGKNNFLEKYYKSAPIGITVEGSNTLTRNLIIFGQGLNKSHPYIYPILDNILNNDINKFSHNFNRMLFHVSKLYIKAFSPFNIFKSRLEIQTIHFANLSNFVALKGGAIKKEQSLSGDMADILSNLYLAYSVKWYENNNNISKSLTEYCIDRLLDENQIKINKIISNLGYWYPFLFLMKKNVREQNYNINRKIYKEIEKNNKIMEKIKENLYIDKDDILGKLEILSSLDKKTDEYKKIYNEIIQVGEYNITN